MNVIELSIFIVGSLVFLSHLFVTLFEKVRIPDVLWLTLIGFALGPVFGLVYPEDFGEVGKIVTKITLIIILFDGGLELDFDTLKKNAGSSLLLTFLAYFVSLGVVYVTLQTFTDFQSELILFYSAVLAGPAPSVVMPVLRKLSASDKVKTILSLESTLGEAFCILVSLAILESIRESTPLFSTSFGFYLASSLVGAVVLGAVTGVIWSLLLGKMRKLQNSLFTTPAFVFIVYGIAELINISGPIAVLCFGIVMGNIRFLADRYLPLNAPIDLKAHTTSEIRFFGEITFLLKIFFFVYLGLSIELSKWGMALLAAGLTVVLFGARVVSVFSVQKLISDRREDRLITGCLFPRGLAAAILAATPIGFGIVDSADLKLAVDYTIVFSIILSSAFLFVIETRVMKRKKNEISQIQTKPSA